MDSAVVAVDNQVSTTIEEDEVILNLDSGMYYGTNPVGARIWQLVQEPITVQSIIETVATEYAITRSQCEDDIRAFVESLAEEDIIEILDEPPQ